MARMLLTLVLALLPSGLLAGPTDPFVAIDPYPVALDAPLIDADGTRTTLGALIGSEPAIVHVWASWCAPCRRELPELAAFMAAPAAADIAQATVIVSLDTAGSDRVFGFLRDDLGLADMPAWHAHRGTRRLSASLRLRGMPATYVLDANGNAVAFHAGPLDWRSSDTAEAMRARLQAR
ncbi:MULTISPECIES: TlpA disulfide reductase family protein [unclassified Roseitalea]|uniref:TlpA disulfide reductase family protein n=1 Tax=unclassified Roseitalea TaxID=2639107 RepID=UPI00273F3EE3|nr:MULTISPECIES: TlpA disulfide reductase family protein [unclassified Roseitalea]